MADNNGNGKKSMTEHYRWITPVLLTVGIAILSGVRSTVENIDDKMFRHLTNDEIHCPKSLVVTKAEFAIYQEMRQRQMESIQDGLNARIDALRVSVDRIIELLEKRK